MFSFSKAAVIIDPSSDEHPSLQRALNWEKLFDLKLELIAADALHDALLHEYLESLAAPLREQGVDVTVTALSGNPAYEVLVGQLCHSQPDIVFHSVRYHARLAQRCLSNQDWELVRACPAPLLLVRDKPWSGQPLFLAAIDPFHHADAQAALDCRILDMATTLQMAFTGDVMAVHSYSPVVGHGSELGDIRDLHLTPCEELLSVFQLPQSQLQLLEGDLTAVLPSLVNDLQADAVVIGAVSRSRQENAFIGYTAERVIDQLDCDVLVVKPENFQCPIKQLPSAGNKATANV